MFNNQEASERAALDGNTLLYFGEHPNQRQMIVNVLRAADAAPTVLRGEPSQMSAETAAFIHANNALIDDPYWVADLIDAPPLSSQPVSYLPRQVMQGENFYPATTQSIHRWDGAYSGPVYHNYGHYYGLGQPGYGSGNSSVAYPMASGSYIHGVPVTGNYTWDAYPTPGAPIMSILPYRPAPATAPFQRRSRSPPEHQLNVHRRRSPPGLNPIAPSFAPGAPAHLSFYNHHATTPNHNLAVYGEVVSRRGAWNFGGMNSDAALYQTRRNEARVLLRQQGRFLAGSDDVRNHIAAASRASSSQANEGEESEDEHEESDEVTAEEEEDEDTDNEHEEENKEVAPKEEEDEDTDDEDQDDDDPSAPPAATAPIHHKRPGKFHKGNYRLSCDECRRKHMKCVRPNPSGSCTGCLQAHGGPKVCKITQT